MRRFVSGWVELAAKVEDSMSSVDEGSDEGNGNDSPVFRLLVGSLGIAVDDRPDGQSDVEHESDEVVKLVIEVSLNSPTADHGGQEEHGSVGVEEEGCQTKPSQRIAVGVAVSIQVVSDAEEEHSANNLDDHEKSIAGGQLVEVNHCERW